VGNSNHDLSRRRPEFLCGRLNMSVLVMRCPLSSTPDCGSCQHSQRAMSQAGVGPEPPDPEVLRLGGPPGRRRGRAALAPPGGPGSSSPAAARRALPVANGSFRRDAASCRRAAGIGGALRCPAALRCRGQVQAHLTPALAERVCEAAEPGADREPPATGRRLGRGKPAGPRRALPMQAPTWGFQPV
jgi:hypothetical protein